MLVSAFAFEHEAALSISEKLLAVFLPVLIKIILELVGRQEYSSLIVYLIGILSFSLAILTENDESVKEALEVAKLIAVNLLVLDSLGLWNRNNPPLNGRHSPILTVWFITYCFCWLWDLGAYFYSLHPFIVEIFSFSIYAALLFLSHRPKPSPYEALP